MCMRARAGPHPRLGDLAPSKANYAQASRTNSGGGEDSEQASTCVSYTCASRHRTSRPTARAARPRASSDAGARATARNASTNSLAS